MWHFRWEHFFKVHSDPSLSLVIFLAHLKVERAPHRGQCHRQCRGWTRHIAAISVCSPACGSEMVRILLDHPMHVPYYIFSLWRWFLESSCSLGLQTRTWCWPDRRPLRLTPLECNNWKALRTAPQKDYPPDSWCSWNTRFWTNPCNGIHS